MDPTPSPPREAPLSPSSPAHSTTASTPTPTPTSTSTIKDFLPSTSAHLYTHRPLPSLPPPPKRPAKSPRRQRPSSTLVPATATVPQARSLPATPLTASAPAPAIAPAERISDFAKNLDCLTKVQRLTGHDVNVLDPAASGRADLLDDDAASSVYSQDQDQDQDQLPRGDYLDHTPGHSRVPSLETDTDGASSRYPSGPPKSPEPGSFGSVRIRVSHDDPRFEDTTDEPHPGVLVEQYLMRRWEKGQGRFSDLRAAGEYHHFATRLAGGPPTSGQQQEQEEEEREKQDRSAPTLRHHRVYLPVPFADDASASCPSLHQQLGEKTSSVPIVSTLLLSSFEVGDRPMRIPDPATRWRPAPKDGGRRSAFDSDSDDDGQGGGHGAGQGAGRSRRHLSMMKIEERPASRNSFFRRSSAVPVPAPPAEQEEQEDQEQQQQQPQGGGFLKELFTGARSRARARMRTSMQGPSKADRRRETMRRQIKVLPDVEEA